MAEARSRDGSEAGSPRRVDRRFGGFASALESIFGSFFAEPDFQRYYERDVSRRVFEAWSRSGKAMWLALGHPATFSVTAPDGGKVVYEVEPAGGDPAYREALERARAAAPGLESEGPEGGATVHAARAPDR